MAAAQKDGKRHAPTQARSRMVVASIVEGAMQLFRRGEDEDVPIQRIAERAGVGIGSVYRYFTSREGVLDALVDKLTAQNFASFERTLARHADAPLEELFEAMLGEVFGTYVESSQLTRVAIRTILRFGRVEAITTERDRFVRLLADRIARDLPGVARKQIDASALAVTDMAMGIAVSETYRAHDPARTGASRDVVRRTFMAELAYLRSLVSPGEPR